MNSGDLVWHAHLLVPAAPCGQHVIQKCDLPGFGGFMVDAFGVQFCSSEFCVLFMLRLRCEVVGFDLWCLGLRV